MSLSTNSLQMPSWNSTNLETLVSNASLATLLLLGYRLSGRPQLALGGHNQVPDPMHVLLSTKLRRV